MVAALFVRHLLHAAYDRVKRHLSWARMGINMNQSRILPFYMAYPLPMYYQQEDSVTRDLEYLQQMYPSQARKFQKTIAETLDHIDYEGSMIYDEYPDKWQIYRLTHMITDKIRNSGEGEPWRRTGIKRRSLSRYSYAMRSTEDATPITTES